MENKRKTYNRAKNSVLVIFDVGCCDSANSSSLLYL